LSMVGSSIPGVELRPLGAALGAEVLGLDVTRMDAEATAWLQEALLQYQLLAIREQQLDPSSFSAFASLFGEREVYPFSQPVAQDPFVVPLVKERDDQEVFGGIWHTDSSYLQNPPSLTLLHAVELPSRGGDTLFANMYAVYEALSPAMRDALDGLSGIYTAGLVHDSAGEFAAAAGADRNRRKPDDVPAEVRHPIVRTHPQTHRKAIYASLAHTREFAGFTREESLPLLEYLAELARLPEFGARLAWQPGTVAIWDNRCVHHYPVNDYAGERREMHRAIIEGERPV
jgi:taurine dioxygenase